MVRIGHHYGTIVPTVNFVNFGSHHWKVCDQIKKELHIYDWDDLNYDFPAMAITSCMFPEFSKKEELIDFINFLNANLIKDQIFINFKYYV